MASARAQELIAAGRSALATAAWADARSAFAEALRLEETPGAYEGLGIAARYQLDADAALAAHEAGYRLARSRGDEEAAALLAVQLSYDAYAFRGPAEALGWVERAAMLVDGKPPSVASAFVPYLRGYLALLADHDPRAAREASAQAAAIARETGAVDLELLALALEGLALVAGGAVALGMRKLDAAAAAAVGGEMADADSIETVCCFLIDACKRVRDIERAREWCLRVRELAARFDDRQMFSVCRTHYADVLLWQGDWELAERELSAAVEELGRLRPGREADAVVRLAELRRRQGRVREAEALLERAVGHRLHPLVHGLAALDRGDPQSALDDAARLLRRIGPEDAFERVAGLDLLRAAVAVGDLATAESAAAEIADTAGRAPNAGLRAAALLAEGRLAAARGRLHEAQLAVEEAGEVFDAAGAPTTQPLHGSTRRRRLRPRPVPSRRRPYAPRPGRRSAGSARRYLRSGRAS
jgi:tetratricopeptide (TPR) repeat protein